MSVGDVCTFCKGLPPYCDHCLGMSDIVKQYHYVQETDDHLIALNSYQCANIVWLCKAIGYGHSKDLVEPFGYANTGDWLGELHNLAAAGCDPENNKPNISIDELRETVQWWFDSKVNDKSLRGQACTDQTGDRAACVKKTVKHTSVLK